MNLSRSRLPSDEARRLWWLVHNGDAAGVVRRGIYLQLQRGRLVVPLNPTERALCVSLAEAERTRLSGKVDAASRTVDSLLDFLNKAPGVDE